MELVAAQSHDDRFDRRANEQHEQDHAAIETLRRAMQHDGGHQTEEKRGRDERPDAQSERGDPGRRPHRATTAQVRVREGAQHEARALDDHEPDRAPPRRGRDAKPFARQLGDVDAVDACHYAEPPYFGHAQMTSGGTASNVPTTRPHGVKINMIKPTAVPSAAGKDQIVGPGSSMRRTGVASRALVNRSSRRSRASPVTTGRSSGRAGSQLGSRLITTGMSAKLPGGGGELVAHSSVSAPHGSLPARGPVKRLTIRFATVTRTPRARI